MLNCLFILPGPVPPEKKPEFNRFNYLGSKICGCVIQPSWDSSDFLTNQLNRDISNFTFVFKPYEDIHWLLRFFKDLFFLTKTGLKLHFSRQKFDAVICYGLTKTAIAAYIIKLVTGAKMILEIPCNPKKAFIAEEMHPSLSTKFRYHITQLLNNFWFRQVDGLRYLYPDQIEGFTIGRKVKTFVFAEFLPVSCLRKSESSDLSIVFLGYPWYRKGVDILIQAFNQLSSEFPKYELKLIGAISDKDKEYLQERFVRGNSKIHFIKPAPWAEVMEKIAQSKFMVLPSRSEAMGRVWLEAMALGKPVICSRVDGIPHYVKQEENGLLFNSEDIEGLYESMKRLVTDSELYTKLATRGYNYAHNDLDEKAYVNAFAQMVEKVCI